MQPIVATVATLALVLRAYHRNSLTPFGIVVAALTAVAHAVHPWGVFFWLLVVFFLAGTTVTKVKHEVKAKLTHSSSGSPGGEGPRNHIQVLANSGVASILIVAHAWSIRDKPHARYCWSSGQNSSDVLVAGIVANYAAVAADTFSSELGILATSHPRLITAPWRVVAPGTNGGVTAIGLGAGLLGSLIISLVATVLLPFCPGPGVSREGGLGGRGWALGDQVTFMLVTTLIGLGGSLLDSLLGAVLQASVIDVRTGKVIEGEGGGKVLIHGKGLRVNQRQRAADITGLNSGDAIEDLSGQKLRNRKGAAKVAGTQGLPQEHHESRKVATGVDVLSNNAVNLLMAAVMSTVAILGAAWNWDISLREVISDLSR